MFVYIYIYIFIYPVLEPTTSTPSPRKILDFHDTNSKSTQDLGFFKNHTRVSRILAGTCVGFQVLLFFYKCFNFIPKLLTKTKIWFDCPG